MASAHTEDLVTFFGSTVVRVRALEKCGVARSTIMHRCRSGGPWQSLMPGIVLLHNGPPTRVDRRRAALLYCGDHYPAPVGHRACVLTGLDALDLHGMRGIPSPSGPVHVLVPTQVQRSGAGRVLVERTRRLPVPAPGRWPLAPVARAALDFTRRCREPALVRAVLAEAVQRGLCAPAELDAELAAGSARGSALPRAVLSEIDDGVRSVAEAAARAVLAGSGLPAPLWNPTLYDPAGRFLAVPDAWFDDVAMAWEIDSLEWHLGPADYARTVDRRALLMAQGVIVVHHLPATVRRRPEAVVADLRANYAQAKLRPRPGLRAVPAERRAPAGPRAAAAPGT